MKTFFNFLKVMIIAALTCPLTHGAEVESSDAENIKKTFNEFIGRVESQNIEMLECIHTSTIRAMRSILESKLKQLEAKSPGISDVVGMPQDRSKLSDLNFVKQALKYSLEKSPEKFIISRHQDIRIRGMVKDEESVYLVYSVPDIELGLTEPSTMSFKEENGNWKIDSILFMKTIGEIWRFSVK